MFVLKKILNGRINVSEPLYMTAAVDLKAGEAVKHGSAGTLAKVSADDTAEYVVLADVGDDRYWYVEQYDKEKCTTIITRTGTEWKSRYSEQQVSEIIQILLKKGYDFRVEKAER